MTKSIGVLVALAAQKFVASSAGELAKKVTTQAIAKEVGLDGRRIGLRRILCRMLRVIALSRLVLER